MRKAKWESLAAGFRGARGSAYRVAEPAVKAAWDSLVADLSAQAPEEADWFSCFEAQVRTWKANRAQGSALVDLMCAFAEWVEAQEESYICPVAFPPVGFPRWPIAARRAYWEEYWLAQTENGTDCVVDEASGELVWTATAANVAHDFWLKRDTVEEDFAAIKERYGLSGLHGMPAISSLLYSFSGQANLTQLARVLALLAAQAQGDYRVVAGEMWNSLSARARALLLAFWEVRNPQAAAYYRGDFPPAEPTPCSEWERFLQEVAVQRGERYVIPWEHLRELPYLEKIRPRQRLALQVAEEVQRQIRAQRSSLRKGEAIEVGLNWLRYDPVKDVLYYGSPSNRNQPDVAISKENFIELSIR